ncbi:MAG: glycosyltransferase family 4 protein [Candidatus Aenigmatarchaeota archaeon]
MKIAQICPFFYPVKGGLEESVFQISKELINKGHEVEVLTSDSSRDGKIKESFEIIDGIKVFRFNTIFSLGDFGKVWPGFIIELIRKKYDIIHVHNYRHVHTILSALICKIKNIPCVLTTHSPFHPPTIRKSLSRFFILFYDLFLGRVFDRFFSRIILITNSEIKYFKHVNKNKIIVIPNGISDTTFRKVNEKAIRLVIRRFNLRKNDKIILFVGRIHPTKGLYFLLQSFYELSKTIKGLKLIIVGPIQDQKYYKELIQFINLNKLSVIFTGYITEDEKIALYSLSSVLVLPSIYEPFGIVILEAFARGKPVIAVESDGPEYLIKNGENGFLVKYGDIKSLASCIELLLKDKKLYKRISLNNKKKAVQFTWSKIVNKLIKVYEEILEK